VTCCVIQNVSTNALWSLKDGPQFGCGKQMILVIQSYLLDFQIMFFSTPYGRMIYLGQLKKKKTIMFGFLSMWSFGS